MLIRHGETEWSAAGRHTSVTDVDLTGRGVIDARRVAGILLGLGVRPVAVYSSPRTRSRRTAELAGLADPVVLDDLSEWHYGDYEGLTTEQIRSSQPGWVFTDGSPGGESARQASDRADRVLRRVTDGVAGDVVLVGHGHFSRVLATRWIGLEVAHAGAFGMDPGHVTVLGWYHEDPTLDHVNVPPLPLWHGGNESTEG